MYKWFNKISMGFYDEYPQIKEDEIKTGLKNFGIRNKSTSSVYFFPSILLVCVVVLMIITFKEYSQTQIINNRNVLFGFIMIFFAVISILHSKRINNKLFENEYLKKYGTKSEGEIVKMGSLGKSVDININGQVFTKKIDTVQNRRFYKPNEWYEPGEKYNIAYNPDDISDFVILNKIE